MKKYLLSTLMLLSTGFVIADGHTSAEKKVLNALETYFEARNNQDWKTVVVRQKKGGINNSENKPKQKTISKQILKIKS